MKYHNAIHFFYCMVTKNAKMFWLVTILGLCGLEIIHTYEIKSLQWQNSFCDFSKNQGTFFFLLSAKHQSFVLYIVADSA